MSEITLIELVEKTGTELKKHNNEWRGPCPIHGGKNPTSFVIRQGKKGLIWTCYSDCNTYGGEIKFVMMMWKKTYKEALEILEIEYLPERTTIRTIAPSAKPPPSDQWQNRATKLIEESISNLGSFHGERARIWLNKRGITDTTIKRWNLGYIPQEKFETLPSWGLTIKNKKAVWIPRGILIPCIKFDKIWYLKIRRAIGNPKIPQVLGSRPALFEDINTHKTAFITEGEFDAILLHQEAGDLIGIATMGAAGHLPKGVWLNKLLGLEKIFVIGDNDPAGQKNNKKWKQFSSRISSARAPTGNDITDYWKSGGNLRDWVKYILAKEKPMPIHKTIEIKPRNFSTNNMTQSSLELGLQNETERTHYYYE